MTKNVKCHEKKFQKIKAILLQTVETVQLAGSQEQGRYVAVSTTHNVVRVREETGRS